MQLKFYPILLLLLLFSAPHAAKGEKLFHNDTLFVEQLLQHSPQIPTQSRGERLLFFAKQFLGTPYVAATLEQKGEEKLVVNCHEVDCTTLIEQVVALTCCDAAGKKSYEAFCHALQDCRYRNGMIAGYTSRLHYFSDWIAAGEERGVLREISCEQSATPYPMHIDFMSRNSALYPALKGNGEAIEAMRGIEKSLSERAICYIPREQLLQNSLDWMESGDIIAITTPIAGLDVVHVGIAVRQADGVHLLHASSKAGGVIIDTRTIGEQVAALKSQSGIRVMRLLP